MSISFLNPEGQPPPVGQYTNVAIVPAGEATAQIAGQLPVDSAGAVLAPGDFDQQAELVFERLRSLLEGIGSGLAEVAMIRAYMVREEDFARFREIRRRAFAEAGVTQPPPATTLVVKGLYGGALIELDAVAVVPAAAAEQPR
jgi:enamine deaminase RidA (YjgF/YER057c/UK114 family)